MRKELVTLRQNLKASRDQLNRKVLLLPLLGVVTGLNVTTVGGVVRPGEEIMKITPLDGEPYVEAQVKPGNIANIRPGQQATIKLTAHGCTICGGLMGRVDVINANTFGDDRPPEPGLHCKATVKVNLSAMSNGHVSVEVGPRMMADAELYIGEKAILQCLLKPRYNSREA
ncbi:HlyD family efflux transporter periplasmic adaptor subunit [Salipiger aestuarii]|uniref:Adhesin transport system membrane fusion protein n=1 Tax=Salipiger aestuarii TaxID=568098 RepID=A0A327YAF0_9RHOB|nr:HlyD family efflux transporter periplasmic adaptor subunit [Salipiger aestuarii]RAK15469.1 adhesin transport system membrane fusion protein [Salipiger aestuarii]